MLKLRMQSRMLLGPLLSPILKVDQEQLIHWAKEADKRMAIRGRGSPSCISYDCLHGKLKEPRGKPIELIRMFNWALGSESNMLTDQGFPHIETVSEKIPLGMLGDCSSRSFTLQQRGNTTG